MRFFSVVLVSLSLFGCAAKSPMVASDGAYQLSADDIAISINNIKPKSDNVVAQYPDESGVRDIFLAEINGMLAEFQAKKGVLAVDAVGQAKVVVTYNRHFTLVGSGITLPGGSYSVTAVDQAGDKVWEVARNDIVITGRAWLNIPSIYKVPFGFFRQNEERKHLRMWARVIAEDIYAKSRKRA